MTFFELSGGELVATCGGGLEPVLERELLDLGVRLLGTESGAVRFAGGAAEVVRANHWLRSASRVLVPICRGEVRDAEAVYQLITRLPWEILLPADNTFVVQAVTKGSLFRDSRFAALRVKDAVVDRQRSRTKLRSSIQHDQANVALVLYADEQRFELSVDSSGDPLHLRGYRQESGDAPLRETLAAGLLLMAGWGAAAGAGPQRNFWDPFCGSGTIAIEAALIGARIAPGSLRNQFGFERWPQPLTRESAAILAPPAAQPATPPSVPPAPVGARLIKAARIVGSDNNPRVLRIARENAARAGVAHLIEFRNQDAGRIKPQAARGLIVTNPPYGERISGHTAGAARPARGTGAPNDDGALLQLYAAFGSALKEHFSGWDAWVFTANRRAANEIGLRAAARIPLYNGTMECRLLHYPLFAASDGDS